MPSDAAGRFKASAGPAVLLAGSAALLAGAWGFEIIGGLMPCEMCWWQRWALLATAFLAFDALLLGQWQARQPILRLAALLSGWLALLAMAGNAGLALFHVGVEQKWWQGLTRCTAPPLAGDMKSMMADILAQPLVRCDAIPWQMFGISMAGWNFLIALVLAGVAAWLMLKPRS
ncbi:disulfide bond formation protein B [Sandarakinorhabdus sp.]|jgi:disulfide bond formation protein DsbB|uniref:disulfide bond formation protein B n=1 Tax=Sandarakinorhabdus sp. TaxID=1916663 RepID=UPI0033407FDC